MKVIGFILFYIRLSQKGDKVLWSTDKATVGQGSMGSARMWTAPSPNQPATRYWAPETPYSPDDLQQLKDGGYDTIYVKEDGSEYYTVAEMNQRLKPLTSTEQDSIATTGALPDGTILGDNGLPLTSQ